jgi:NADH:ubiquinone oxidoreductase subunit 4 (subunit M)
MLLHAVVANLAVLVVFVLSWFLASWYLFRMMQRLLFGRHRAEVSYEDLRAGELACFALLLLLLAIAGTIQPASFEPGRFEKVQTIAMGMMRWQK